MAVKIVNIIKTILNNNDPQIKVNNDIYNRYKVKKYIFTTEKDHVKCLYI